MASRLSVGLRSSSHLLSFNRPQPKELVIDLVLGSFPDTPWSCSMPLFTVILVMAVIS